MRSTIMSVLEVIAGGLIVAGVWLLSVPAGLIVAGLIVGVFCWRASR